jgi:hypothetical protein
MLNLIMWLLHMLWPIIPAIIILIIIWYYDKKHGGK